MNQGLFGVENYAEESFENDFDVYFGVENYDEESFENDDDVYDLLDFLGKRKNDLVDESSNLVEKPVVHAVVQPVAYLS